jgi:RNA-directed DNA polymerase
MFSRFHPSRKRQLVFLGFAFYWGVDVKGKLRLRRRTASKKQQTSLSEFYHFIKAKRSQKLAIWLPQLKRKLTGFRNYFGLPDNSRSVSKLPNYVLHSLHKWLNRRSGRRSYNWSNFNKMLEYFQIQKLRVSKRVSNVD